MIPEFSYCECEHTLYSVGLFKNSGGVVYSNPPEVLDNAISFWFDEWKSYPFVFRKPTKLLLPGGLI